MTTIQDAIRAVIPDLDSQGIICPYCNRHSKIVNGDVIYPHRKDLTFKKFHLCAQCEAYVGCHDKTGKPLGRLADAELRGYKVRAHYAFDPLWKSGVMTRTQAYSWLTDALKPYLNGPAHIGEFDVEMCKRVIAICNRRRNAND